MEKSFAEKKRGGWSWEYLDCILPMEDKKWRERRMRISESCANCLYDKQANKVKDQKYLNRVKEILLNRKPEDTSPYMVYLFEELHKEMFGHSSNYSDIKKQFNDFVLEIENSIREKIKQADDPMLEAFKYARVGNYIDFGAMNSVDTDQFLDLLEHAELSKRDKKTYDSFVSQCERAKSFLLICDNCGEIVLDKLFLEQVKLRFSNIELTVLVRGGEVLNDVTKKDAQYVGMDHIAKIIDNGNSIAGTIYDMLPNQAKDCIDAADVILAKGQGNYESLSGNGRHIFYSFLCKCDLFTKRFDVPQFTGIFIEEVK